MNKIPINIVLKPGVNVPKYGTEFSSGFDLAANLQIDSISKYQEELKTIFSKLPGVDYTIDFVNQEIQLIIYPGKSIAIPTGIYMAIPEGYEMQVRPRSGNAIKLGLVLANTPGTVDSDFRGEIMVLAHNHSDKPVTIVDKMRIAQGIIAPVYQADWNIVDTLEKTTRGDGGYGHTGTH